MKAIGIKDFNLSKSDLLKISMSPAMAEITIKTYKELRKKGLDSSLDGQFDNLIFHAIHLFELIVNTLYPKKNYVTYRN